jgi:drug/metabolite transporter (DMT)-like permease
VAFLSFGLAVLAAAVNARSSVLQRKANRERPAQGSLDPRSVVTLVRNPVWLAGISAVVLSFLLSAAALRFGRLTAVQPVLVLELPLTLVFGRVVLGTALRIREWSAAAAMSAGVAGVVWSLSPAAGNGGAASGPAWATAGSVTVAVIAAVAVAGTILGGSRRPVLLGIAAGMTFGLTAAFTKGMTAQLAKGFVPALTAWETYAMVAAGIAGLYLVQSALASGRLLLAQPGITLADPAVAVLWGVLVFGEQTRGGWYVGLAVLAAAMLAAGVLALVRSPALQRAERLDGAAAEEPGQCPAAGRAERNRRTSEAGSGAGTGRLSTNAPAS